MKKELEILDIRKGVDRSIAESENTEFWEQSNIIAKAVVWTAAIFMMGTIAGGLVILNMLT